MATIRYEYVQLYGGQFVVNSTTANQQAEPQVAALDNGGFVAAWSHYFPPVGGTTNYTSTARVFNAQRTPLAADQMVSQTGFKLQPEVVTFSDGRSLLHFTVTFGSADSYPNYTIGTNGILQTGVVGAGFDIAKLSGNTAVILGLNQGTGQTGIRGQIVTETSPTTAPTVSAGFDIATFAGSGGHWDVADAARLSTGLTVYVWTQEQNTGGSVWFRTFTGNGSTPLGAQTLIANTGIPPSSTTLENIVVTPLQWGGFAVAYVTSGGTGVNIMLDVLDSNGGRPRGGPTQVNVNPITGYNGGINPDPAITTLSDGSIVVGWAQSQSEYLARVFNDAGVAVSNTFGFHGSSNAFGALGDLAALGADTANGIRGNRLVMVSTDTDIQGIVVEMVRHTTGDASGEVLTGNDYHDIIDGLGGNDQIDGKLGNDELNGGDGDDKLVGGGGNDTVNGGNGNDTAYYSGPRASYSVTMSGGRPVQVVDLRSGSPDGTDTLIDVENASFSDTPPANRAPVVAVSNHTLGTNVWATVSSWISYSDADGNAATQYEFRDGGTAANSGYFWTPSNAHHPANTSIVVAASDLGNVWIRGGQAGGSETMSVRAFDGTAWSAWDDFTLTTNSGPAATIADHSLRINQWSQLSSWMSYSDVDGNPATQYQFWDSGTLATSGYFWTPTNPHHAADTAITVAAADLSNLWVRGGQAAGSETMWVRAFDGTDWGAWDSFTFTTLNTAPTATINDHTLRTNEWSAVASWISYLDADGNAATQYQFWDEGTATTSGYFWTPSNPHHDANTPITVAAADLSNVWVRGGQIAGSETMRVRAFDGTDWGAWDTFTLTTQVNTAPVATINDHALRTNEWSTVASWISYSDADGNPATMYQFSDGGTLATSGYFWTPSNPHHPADTAITVAAADLNNVWVRGGQVAGSETMWVRAFDGVSWGAWDAFTLTTQANNPPVATINDHTLHINEWSRVASWLSYSDADGNAATQYQFCDSGPAATSGYFWTPSNPHHPADTAITVAAADLNNVWVRGGQIVGSETMWVRAFDGSNWGNWDAFTLITQL